MTLAFKPTPHQAGHAIGLAIGKLASQLSGGSQEEWLRDASVTAARYQAELLLLSAAAALHALESSALAPATEAEVVSGFSEWIRSLETEPRELLLTEVDKVTDYYADAASTDERHPASITDLCELEAAFADRLLALGENNEARGHACLRLSLVVPKMLWPVQYAAARQMLGDASLLLIQ